MKLKLPQFSWLYWDAPLGAFVLVMLAAAAITSHGTFVFYSYILPFELAIAATVVLTVGIPLLELAAVLDRGSRLYYVTGMVVLLLMEAAAQYLQGQAHFADRVRAQFPDPSGVDLATFASHPAGRLLPILYLAILSAVVVYFGYAASARVRDLRASATRRAQETSELVELRAMLTQERDQHAQARTENAHLRADIAHEQNRTAQLTAHYEQTISQLREAAAHPPVVEGLDLLKVARRLREADVSLRETAELIGLPESTLRGRLKSSTNGVLPN
jgi:hypothetical protein